MITPAAIVGSTAHRVLFLEERVKVPLLPAEPPLRGFHVVAPTVLVVLHLCPLVRQERRSEPQQR